MNLYKVGDRIQVTRAHHWKPQGLGTVTDVDGQTINVLLDNGTAYFIGFDERTGDIWNSPDFGIVGHSRFVTRAEHGGGAAR